MVKFAIITAMSEIVIINIDVLEFKKIQISKFKGGVLWQINEFQYITILKIIFINHKLRRFGNFYKICDMIIDNDSFWQSMDRVSNGWGNFISSLHRGQCLGLVGHSLVTFLIWTCFNDIKPNLPKIVMITYFDQKYYV